MKKDYTYNLTANQINGDDYRKALIISTNYLITITLSIFVLATDWLMRVSLGLAVSLFLPILLGAILLIEWLYISKRVGNAKKSISKASSEHPKDIYLTTTINNSEITSQINVADQPKIIVKKSKMSRLIIKENFIILVARPELYRFKDIIFIPFNSAQSKNQLITELNRFDWKEKKYSIRYFVYLAIIYLVTLGLLYLLLHSK